MTPPGWYISRGGPVVWAADHVITALGRERMPLLLRALRAGWLTRAEAAELEPLAVAIAWLLESDVPQHRGADARVIVQ